LKVVYICAPYSGATGKNLRNVRAYAREEVDGGNVPFVPHFHYREFMDEDGEREEILEMCEEMVGRCDAVHVYGPKITSGMKREIDAAESFGLNVVYMNE
jgi:hypothetical protein